MLQFISNSIMRSLYTLLIILQIQSMYAQHWTHVGPVSTNLLPVNGKPNLFETAQVNLIEVNPWNNNHWFCGGRFAGLWESKDAGKNWTRIPTQHLGSNGVGKIHFLGEFEVFVSNLHVVVGGVKVQYSMESGIYNSKSKSWETLKKLSPDRHTIHDVTSFTENQKNFLLVCSSNGVFLSDNRGKSWTQFHDLPTQSVKILRDAKSKLAGFVFGGSSQAEQAPELRFCSLNGLIKNQKKDLKSVTLPTYNNLLIRSNTQVVLGAVNQEALVELGEVRSTDDFDVFVLSDQDVTYSRKQGQETKVGTSSHLMLSKVTFHKNQFENPILVDHDTHLGQSILFGARTGLIYDPIHKGVWFSGVKLHFAYDPKVSNKKFRGIRQGFKTGKGIIHDDIHELRIYHDRGQRYLLAACDGGIARSLLPINADPEKFNPASDLFFEGFNNGLHVMLVNGFSGASEDPNFYVMGGFDITNTDFFRADEGRNEHTEPTWENAGGIIDLFDNSRIIIDVSLYNHFYRVVKVNDKRVYRISENRTFYAPLKPGVAPITANPEQFSSNHEAVIGFQRRNFVQDPFRPGRIFYVKHKVGLHQLDTASGLFVRKLDLAELNPELEWAGWSNDWRWWRSVSFSPQTPNSMHIIINGSDDPKNNIQNPMVIKYIGRNLDACFGIDKTRLDEEGRPQWRLISERLFNRFNKVMGTQLTREQIRDIDLVDIETSTTNPNRIYLVLRSKHDPSAKIVVFDGRRWLNYGQGLPTEEFALAMVMDYRSNDGIYLSTDKNIFYRDRNMSEWVNFSGNYPKLNAEQLEINYKENTLRAGTFGLGIWKTSIEKPGTVNK
jgi:hypothetical protein